MASTVLYEGNNLKPLKSPFMILMMVLTLGILLIVILIVSRQFPRRVWTENGKFYGDTKKLLAGCEPGQMGYLLTLMKLGPLTLGRYIVVAVPKDAKTPIDWSTSKTFNKTAWVTGLCNRVYLPAEDFDRLLKFAHENMQPIPKNYTPM